MNEEKLWEAFESAIDDVALNQELAEMVFKKLKELENRNLGSEKSQKKKLNEKLKGLQARREELYEHFTTGLLDELTYRRVLKKTNKEISELKEKMHETTADSRSILDSAESLLELSKELKTLWKLMPDAERLIVLKKLCSNPSLNGTSVEYHLRKPFKILAEIKKNRKNLRWCAWRESNPHALRH